MALSFYLEKVNCQGPAFQMWICLIDTVDYLICYFLQVEFFANH